MLALRRSGLLLPGCVFRVITSTEGTGAVGWAGEAVSPRRAPAPGSPVRAAAAPGAAPSRRQHGHNFPAPPSAPGFKPREVEPLAAPIPPPLGTSPPALASVRPSRPVPVPEVPSGLAVPGNGEFPREPCLGHGEKGYIGMLRDAPPRAGAPPRSGSVWSCGNPVPGPGLATPGSVLSRKERAEPGPVLPCPGKDVLFHDLEAQSLAVHLCLQDAVMEYKAGGLLAQAIAGAVFI